MPGSSTSIPLPPNIDGVEWGWCPHCKAWCTGETCFGKSDEEVEECQHSTQKETNGKI